MCLAAYLGVVRTSGVVGLGVYRYGILALELYPEHDGEAVRLMFVELKAKGMRPRVVVSNLAPAYGCILPQVFPHAIHHKCIFHVLQQASRQMFG